MDWQVLPISEYSGDLWMDWQSLAQRHHRLNPMLDAVFVELLVANFGHDVRVAVGHELGDLQALALLQPGTLRRWCGFKPSQAQAALIVLSPDCRVELRKLFKAMPNYCAKIDFFSLDPREHSALLREMSVDEKVVGDRDMCVDVDGSFDQYWEQRPRNLKKNLRRYRKRIVEEVGPLRFVAISDPGRVAMAVDRYGILESRGWKGLNGTALHPGNRQGYIYRQLMANMAEKARAYVFELYAGENFLASRLCVKATDMLVILKTTFNEDYKRYAAGRLLLQDVLQHVFEARLVSFVDFYTNADKDQMEWATSERNMINASIYRSALVRQLFGIAKALAGIAKTSRGR